MFCPACFNSTCSHPKEGWHWVAYALLAPLVVVGLSAIAVGASKSPEGGFGESKAFSGLNDAKQNIKLRLDRSICSSPCAIQVTVQVDPEAGLAAESRICLYVDDGVPVTVSCWPYSGKRESDIRLSGIPAGDYSVDLRREQNNVLLASAFLRVIGFDH